METTAIYSDTPLAQDTTAQQETTQNPGKNRDGLKMAGAAVLGGLAGAGATLATEAYAQSIPLFDQSDPTPSPEDTSEQKTGSTPTSATVSAHKPAVTQQPSVTTTSTEPVAVEEPAIVPANPETPEVTVEKPMPVIEYTLEDEDNYVLVEVPEEDIITDEAYPEIISESAIEPVADETGITPGGYWGYDQPSVSESLWDEALADMRAVHQEHPGIVVDIPTDIL